MSHKALLTYHFLFTTTEAIWEIVTQSNDVKQRLLKRSGISYRLSLTVKPTKRSG